MERVCVGGWDVEELRYLQLELTWRALGGKDGVVSVNHCCDWNVNVGTLKQRQAMGGDSEAPLVVWKAKGLVIVSGYNEYHISATDCGVSPKQWYYRRRAQTQCRKLHWLCYSWVLFILLRLTSVMNVKMMLIRQWRVKEWLETY